MVRSDIVAITKKTEGLGLFFVIVLFYFTKSNIIGTTFRLPFVGVK